MARRSYAEMAAEARVTVEQYKANLEAKKNGATATAPVRSTTEIAPVDGEEAPPDAVEDADDVNRVKLCESRGIFGIIPHKNKRYVTLVRRVYYEEEATTDHPRWGVKVHPAGSHGPWQLTKAVYPKDTEAALLYVAKALEDEYLDQDEANDIRNLVAITKRVRDEMIQHFKG